MRNRERFERMKEQLKKGVTVVVAPQHFPTPPDLAALMAEYLKPHPLDRVLEPSAGTGSLIDAVIEFGEVEQIHAIEISHALSENLRAKYHSAVCHTSNLDFLKIEPHRSYDKIIMNPPFRNGEDINHTKHALSFLRPSGRLVGLCANGPRQERELQPLCTHWEDLPPGSFKCQGTNVNTALFVIDN